MGSAFTTACIDFRQAMLKGDLAAAERFKAVADAIEAAYPDAVAAEHQRFRNDAR